MTTTKITKAQYNALSIIFQNNPNLPFSANDMGENPRTLAALERKGILQKSSMRYIGSNEQLYTVNYKAAVAAHQRY